MTGGPARAIPGGVPAALWARVAAAPARLLILDYDGTLAPFRTRREEAVAPPRVHELLGRIAASGRRSRLAVVSGRPVAEMEALLPDLHARLVGEHGWEARAEDGRTIRYPLPALCAGALERAEASARGRGWGGRLERKRTALMLHTRGLPEAEALGLESSCARLWEPERASASLRLVPVDGGVELRAPGRHKGTAVRELLAEAPAGALAVYLGDDETDEDAFLMLRAAGYGILVSPERRPTLASGWIRYPEGVAEFLERWLALEGPPCGEPRGARGEGGGP